MDCRLSMAGQGLARKVGRDSFGKAWFGLSVRLGSSGHGKSSRRGGERSVEVRAVGMVWQGWVWLVGWVGSARQVGLDRIGEVSRHGQECLGQGGRTGRARHGGVGPVGPEWSETDGLVGAGRTGSDRFVVLVWIGEVRLVGMNRRGVRGIGWECRLGVARVGVVWLVVLAWAVKARHVGLTRLGLGSRLGLVRRGLASRIGVVWLCSVRRLGEAGLERARLVG